MKLNTIPELIEDIRAGRMIVLIDDEDRENEGDLIMAASMVRPEDINFMAHNGRGLICMPITRERCEQLNLLLMVNRNETRFATNFTVSIEAAEGISTGISAYDRAHTIRTASRPDVGPANISQPGHVFPIMAQPGGVLTRAGHTEAGVDLAMLSGLEPAAVLVEILNEDGTMARRPQLEVFAQKHDLKIGTIADLIRYRLETERSVECISSSEVETDFGPFRLLTYRDSINDELHLALLKGEVDPDEPMLVRVHVQNPLSDVLSIKRNDFGLPLRLAMAQIARQGKGMVLVLGGHEENDSLLRRIQKQPEPSVSSDGDNKQSSELRTYGIGAQIIVDIGIRKMRVLSAPKHMTGLAGFGLEVVEYVEGEHYSDEYPERNEAMSEFPLEMPERKCSIALVASEFNHFIVQQLVDGAYDALNRNGVAQQNISLVWVPGAFELPLAVDVLASNGNHDAVIALGAVIRGGTPHFDYVAGECSRGLANVGLKYSLPVIFGVLTTDTVDQALERAGSGAGNKGFDTAVAALQMIALMDRLRAE